MSVVYTGFYLTQWLFYFLRRILFICYGLLQFTGKPGSRWIVPILLGVGMYLTRGTLQADIAPVIGPFAEGLHDILNGTPSAIALAQRKAMHAYYGYDINVWGLNASLVVIFLVLSIVYVLASQLLAILLGAFPKVTRPLIPVRRLKPTVQDVKSAVVTSAVPKLKRPK